MAAKYHLRDWVEDWEEMLRQSLTVAKEQENEQIRAYFLSRYQTPSEARWRCLRIFAALRYLEANASLFEKSGWVVASSKSGTVTKYLTSALYRFFGVADDTDVMSPPDPQVFMDAAAEHERNDP
jgi:beta-phosphoglucomutase-like phosphatase (HAD superfamily)